jgi:hypothetical protein
VKKKRYDPSEAACAVVKFLPANPAYWLTQATLAGMRVKVASSGEIISELAPVLHRS